MKSVEILMAEDSPSDAELAREALKNGMLDINMNVVTDGEEAINYLFRLGDYKDAVRPDLILLDINMPKKSGLEVLAQIKQDEDLKRIPVVILTPSEDQRDIAKSYEHYAACFITKPVNFQSFQEIVAQLKSFWFTIVTLPPKIN